MRKIRLVLAGTRFYSLRLGIIAMFSLGLAACGSQNHVVEMQKGEIDYLIRENEQLHRIIAVMESNGGERPSESEINVLSIPRKTEVVAEASSSGEKLEEEKSDASIAMNDENGLDNENKEPPNSSDGAGVSTGTGLLDQVEEEPVDVAIDKVDEENEKPSGATEDEAIKLIVGPAGVENTDHSNQPELATSEKPILETEVDSAVYNATKARILAANKMEEDARSEKEDDSPKLDPKDESGSNGEIEQASISELGESEVLEDENSGPDVDSMTPEEREKYEWDNRPRQRPAPPLASLSTRQFFEDGTANLTKAAKTYLKLVAGILAREHSQDTIEIESQDVADEPDLLTDRLNTVLQELEKAAPGFMERVELLPTPRTLSNSRRVEDPHHIKIYPVR